MAVASVVKLSELEGAKRLDADRYIIKFLQLENNLKKIPNIRNLRSVIVEPVRTGHTPRDREVREDDKKIRFIKTDTLREGLIDFENSDFLPARSLSEREYLKSNDVIVTIIGAHYDIIGRAAIFLKHYPPSVVNQNIAVIRSDEELLNPFYLMVFLNSKYGREQLWMLSRQTEQVNLNCREVEKLLVPIFELDFQHKMETLARKSSGLIEKSETLYSQAENLLLEKSGLKAFEPKYDLSYSDNLRKAFGVNRLDAEYFQPCYEELLARIRKINCPRLSQLAERIQEKTTLIPDEYYKYVEISDIETTIGTPNYTERLGKELPPNARIPIKGGELIISKVRPTRGAICIIPKELNANVICSSAFSVFNAASPLKEYLYMATRSIIGRLQMERPTTGSSYPTINDKDVENIEIPILSDETQQEIASLVQEAHEARKRSKESLEEAERKIEEAIEDEC